MKEDETLEKNQSDVLTSKTREQTVSKGMGDNVKCSACISRGACRIYSFREERKGALLDRKRRKAVMQVE